jgi:hypothetical protein
MESTAEIKPTPGVNPMKLFKRLKKMLFSSYSCGVNFTPQELSGVNFTAQGAFLRCYIFHRIHFKKMP